MAEHNFNSITQNIDDVNFDTLTIQWLIVLQVQSARLSNISDNLYLIFLLFSETLSFNDTVVQLYEIGSNQSISVKTNFKMSPHMRKTSLWVFDGVPHKPACTVTGEGLKL